MAVEPSEENITMVVEITQADRNTAIRYLKVKDNDPEKAINALFEVEDITQQEVPRLGGKQSPSPHIQQSAHKWDDTAWSTDRYGATANDLPSTSYNDSNLRPLGTSAAPTRGSSPVPSLRNPSPVGGAAAGVPYYDRPRTQADEDAELERALAASRGDQPQSEQESGTITASGRRTQFGPATKYHYDPSQWAMTVSAPSDAHETREIIPDVEAHERMVKLGEPRFLKHVPSGDYLPNLLTIAHAIPLAHDMLLCRSHIQHHYGQDQDWWRGHSISLPKIVSTTDDQPAAQRNLSDTDTVAEMQRLMAFLDTSERAYASTESLTKFAAESVNKADMVSASTLDQVLRGWEDAARSFASEDAQPAPQELFHSIVGTTSPEGVTPNMWSLPLIIASENRNPEGTTTLADVMDTTLWDSDPDEESFADNYLERCADVLPMRVSQNDPARTNLGLVVPAELYVDKYLKENIAATRVIRKEMARTRKQILKMETLSQSISNVEHPIKKEKMDAHALLESARQYFAGESRDAVMADYEGRGIDLPGEALGNICVEQSTHSTMSMALSSVLENISAKVRQLDMERLKARELLSKLSQATPPNLPEQTPRHRYTLRGVATKPNVTYVLRPNPLRKVDAEGDTNVTGSRDQDGFDCEDTPAGWRWWRIELDVSQSSSQVQRHKAYQDDVLRSVELEPSSSALLVYASERAMAEDASAPLPRPLADFIRNDNESFQNELKDRGMHNNISNRPGRSITTGWEDEYQIGDVSHPSSRRGSASSTTAVFDDLGGRADDPPMYSSFNTDGMQGAGSWAEDVVEIIPGSGDNDGDDGEQEQQRGLLLDPQQQDSAMTDQVNVVNRAEAGKGGYESPEAHEIHLDGDDEGDGMGPPGDMLAGVGGGAAATVTAPSTSAGPARSPSVHMVDAAGGNAGHGRA